MVQLGLTAGFKRKFLQWEGASLHMKEPISLLHKSDLTKRKKHKGFMKTAEPAYTREAIERMVKILDITYRV